MAKRRSPWHVERDPARLSYAFFISHVGEDADAVRSLKAEVAGLSGRGGRPELSCFLDLHNWEAGHEPSQVIRDYLLRSEYMVAWITPAYLEASRRGWIWFEFAYAELIQLSLNARADFDNRHPYIIPVFRGVQIHDIQRSPLVNYWLPKLFNPDEDRTIPEVARTLVDFYDQEAMKRGLGGPGSSA
jgi:TIR domain